jgi:hypothetical protein
VWQQLPSRPRQIADNDHAAGIKLCTYVRWFDVDTDFPPGQVVKLTGFGCVPWNIRVTGRALSSNPRAAETLADPHLAIFIIIIILL